MDDKFLLAYVDRPDFQIPWQYPLQSGGSFNKFKTPDALCKNGEIN